MTQKGFLNTGKRKTSIARVILTPGGKGNITVNGRALETYFNRPTSRMIVQQPLNLTQTIGNVDIRANVLGGGLTGQAGAIRHGIAKALVTLNAEHRSVLKEAGLITRDARIKERKKYGLKGARARYQFSKR